MFGLPYVVALEPRRYIPLFISASDLTSICGLIVTLKADYGVQRLSNVPFRESDLNLLWEQLEGPAPIEVGDVTSSECTIMLHPTNANDLKWRVWLDKGKETELYADMWVRRTPTDVSAFTAPMIPEIVPPTYALGGINVDASTASYMPTVANISIADIPDGELSDIPTKYDVGIEYPEDWQKLGHRVVQVKVFDNKEHELLKLSGDVGNSLLLDFFVPQFYLEWTIHPYAKLRGISKPITVIRDPELHLVPLEYYPNSLSIAYYLTETVNSPLPMGVGNTYGRELSQSLPSIKTYIDEAYWSSSNTNIEVIDKSFSTYKPNMYVPKSDFSGYAVALSNTHPFNVDIARFDEINIGNG